MAPKVYAIQCPAPRDEDDLQPPACEHVPISQHDARPETLTAFHRLDAIDRLDAVEYGYLQIDHYRSHFKAEGKCQNTSIEPMTKRWVALPRGTRVHSYPCISSNSFLDGKVATKPLHAHMMKRIEEACSEAVELGLDFSDTKSTTSTVASSNDFRRVHFCDGVLPGSWEDSDLNGMASTHELSEPLAEWIFIDRDICGFSLHEYAPDDAEVGDFASSPYALMFLQELEIVENLNSYEQWIAATRKEIKELYQHEERQLDKALLLAGVHVNHIHAALMDGCIYQTSKVSL